MKRRLDAPWLTCETCQADAERSPDVFTFPCEACPNVLLQQSGEVSILAREVMYLASLNPLPEQPIDWSFLFRLVGVTSRRQQRAIYERIGQWAKLERTHTEEMKPEKLKIYTNPSAS